MQVETSYSQWTLPELRRAVSPTRLKRYEILARGDAVVAMQLYHWNSALSEALHGPLQSLEITLRNAVNDRLCISFGDAWYDNPAARLTQSHVQQIHSAKTYLQRARKKTEPPNVISNLNLGFWVGLFSSRYETSLWRSHLRWIFKRAPQPLLRDAVHRQLNRARQLRNRVAHHEPILHLQLSDEYCSILSVIQWLCLATALYTTRQSQFQSILENRPGQVGELAAGAEPNASPDATSALAALSRPPASACERSRATLKRL